MKRILLSLAFLSFSLFAYADKDSVLNMPFGFVGVPGFWQISATQSVVDHKAYNIDCSFSPEGGDIMTRKYRVESVNFIPQLGDTPDGTFILHHGEVQHFYKNYTTPINASLPSVLRLTNMSNIAEAIIFMSCKVTPPLFRR